MTIGACNCGAVQFEVSGPLPDVIMCHCSICRRYTGAAGIAVMVVPNESFKWLAGRELVRQWTKPGHDWQSFFCATCGSPLPGLNDDERTFIPAGLITGEAQPELVSDHIFVESKAPWDEICDHGTLHPQAFGTAPDA